MGFMAGVRAVLIGATMVLTDPEIRKLTAIPIALTALLYALLIAGVLTFSDEVLGSLWARPDSAWLIPVWYVALVAGILALFLIAALLFSTVGEAVGGPFYERIATRILERYGHPVEQPGFVDGTILDIVRSLMFVVPAGFFALLGALPAVGLPFAVLGGTLAWLGFGATAMNPALLVTGHRFGARLSYVRRHFFTILGLGGVVAFSMAVPFLPLLSIPCSIAGAADLYGAANVDASGENGLQSG